MCYFFKLDHKAHYKAKTNKKTVQTNFCNASKPYNFRSNSVWLKLTINLGAYGS